MTFRYALSLALSVVCPFASAPLLIAILLWYMTQELSKRISHWILFPGAMYPLACGWNVYCELISSQPTLTLSLRIKEQPMASASPSPIQEFRYIKKHAVQKKWQHNLVHIGHVIRSWLYSGRWSCWLICWGRKWPGTKSSEESLS